MSEIFLISSITGEGIKPFVKYIKDIKSEAIKNNHNRYTKHFYIVGNTNSGKSTFINKLNKMTNKYSNKEYVANDPVLESLLKE